MTRDDFLGQAINRNMFGLEVGPSYSPTLPRAEGWNVETIDHASEEELRKKYYNITDISRIEKVDYISDARPMSEIISRRGEYDFILASHVIEHITDIVAFLQSCEILLKPTGRLLLIVPDKRRCFDVMQARTMTGEILEAHRRQAVRHNPGNIFDFFSNIADMDGQITWQADTSKKLNLGFNFGGTVKQAKEWYDKAANELEYTDIHAWRFVPSSFRLIMQDLERIGLTNLKEDLFSDTNGFEFYFSASFSGEGCPLNRLELHKAIAWEEIEGLMQIVSASQTIRP